MTLARTHPRETSWQSWRDFLRKFVRITFGHGRWQRLLNELGDMSDPELARLGIDRSEVAAAASYLVSETDHDSVADCRDLLSRWSRARQRARESSAVTHTGKGNNP